MKSKKLRPITKELRKFQKIRKGAEGRLYRINLTLYQIGDMYYYNVYIFTSDHYPMEMTYKSKDDPEPLKKSFDEDVDDLKGTVLDAIFGY